METIVTDNADTQIFNIITVLATTALAFLLLLKLGIFIDNFRRELKYIKVEIARTDGGERRYWKHQKKKLWLSLIPFYRR